MQVSARPALSWQSTLACGYLAARSERLTARLLIVFACGSLALVRTGNSIGTEGAAALIGVLGRLLHLQELILESTI